MYCLIYLIQQDENLLSLLRLLHSVFLLSQLSIGIAAKRPSTLNRKRYLRKLRKRMFLSGCDITVRGKLRGTWFFRMRMCVSYLNECPSSTNGRLKHRRFCNFHSAKLKASNNTTRASQLYRTFGKTTAYTTAETSNEKRLLARENWTPEQLCAACTPRVSRNFHLRSAVKCG